ncbi:MAG: prolipoprotein diacylglyceryl transferase [Desulfotomaculaceae bacterium]|nr:prolipoprotein diacylglyceryl transferase [Desulfotomaculaceae bacterium]MDD4766621.1 prolipoprotein diacylglyceryl transferase [Desulfotomaculaceae bacterium]
MINPVAIQIGYISIHWYGILIDIAFILGAVLAYRQAKISGLSTDHLFNIIILIIPAALIGARLYYVVFNWQSYAHNPLEAFAIWHGGLAIHGGLIAGVIVGYLYIKKFNLNFWRYADAVAPSIILGQAIGRWGNFINQEAYGYPVSSEFISHFPAFIQKQMFIENQYRHPAFLYESLWDLAVFAFLMYIFKRKKFDGQVMLLYLALYSVGRFFIESLRMDSEMLGPFRLAQVISIILIGLAAYFYIKFSRKKQQIK